MGYETKFIVLFFFEELFQSTAIISKSIVIRGYLSVNGKIVVYITFVQVINRFVHIDTFWKQFLKY